MVKAFLIFLIEFNIGVGLIGSGCLLMILGLGLITIIITSFGIILTEDVTIEELWIGWLVILSIELLVAGSTFIAMLAKIYILGG